jgi:hypothetical protein
MYVVDFFPTPQPVQGVACPAVAYMPALQFTQFLAAIPDTLPAGHALHELNEVPP